MFVVTFHGGKGGKHKLHKYDDQGGGGTPYLGDLTPKGKTGFRDIKFVQVGADGHFFLVNSSKDSSQIFQIAPLGLSVFVNGVVSDGTTGLPSVYHPFGIAFDDELKVCYISCQDTNVVVRVAGPNADAPGTPMAISPWLVEQFPGGNFLPGTFVASQLPLSPAKELWPQDVPPITPVAVPPEQGGLGVSLGSDGLPQHSVRGVAVMDNELFVADEVDNCIRVYDADGKYRGQAPDPQGLVKSPVHLLVNEGSLLVSVKPTADETVDPVKYSGPLVLLWDEASFAVVLSNSDALNIENPSGMTLHDGYFYLADRTGKKVYRFDSGLNPQDPVPFISQTRKKHEMPDQPEFLLWVADDLLEAQLHEVDAPDDTQQ